MIYLLKLNKLKFYVLRLEDKGNIGTNDTCEGKKNRTKRQGVSRKDCADTEDKVKSVDKVALEAAEKAVAEENRQSAAKASAEEKIKATENAGTASEQSPAVGEVQEHE